MTMKQKRTFWYTIVSTQEDSSGKLFKSLIPASTTKEAIRLYNGIYIHPAKSAKLAKDV